MVSATWPLCPFFFGCRRSGAKISRALVQSHLRRATQTFPSRIRGDFIFKQKPVLAQNIIPPVLNDVFKFNKVWPRSEFANSDPRDSNAGNWPLEKLMIGPFTLLGDNATFDITGQIPIQTGGSVPPDRLRGLKLNVTFRRVLSGTHDLCLGKPGFPQKWGDPG